MRTILYVDDSKDDQQLLAKLAEVVRKDFDGQAQLIAVATLEQADAVLAGQKIDLMLLDLALADTTEDQAATWLASHVPEAPPIVILTNNVTSEMQMRCLSFGAANYIWKPHAMASPHFFFFLLRNEWLKRKVMPR